MNHDNLTSSKQRQRDKLTAKRLLAVFAFAGLLFGLWVLSTPLHQIYWAAQARVTEAKSAVFAPGSSGTAAQADTEYKEPLITTQPAHHGNAGEEPQQYLSSDTVTDSRHISVLFKHAQQKVSQLWSSGSDDSPPLSENRELLDSLKQPTHLSQASDQSDDTDLPLHAHTTALSPDSITSPSSSAPDPTDLQHVLQEAEDLGFQAAVSSSQLTPQGAQQLGLPAANTPQTYSPSDGLSHAKHESALHRLTNGDANQTSKALVTEDNDQLSLVDSAPLGEAQGIASALDNPTSLGQARNESSNSGLLLPEEDATSFAIRDFESDELGDESIDAMVLERMEEGTNPALTLIDPDDLGEADPSKRYSEEEALLEPAESLASQIHREEEAHRAAAALSAASVAAEDYKLTKEMVQRVAPGGTVMVTWANFHYLDFTMNWVQHVQAANISAYLVGSMDNELLQTLVQRNISCFAMESGLSTGDFGWGSKQFHKMGREKIGLVLTFTEMGFDVVVSDVDTVWLQDPLPYMAQYPEADILVSSDSLHATTTDGALEMYPGAGIANIGIMLFRSSAMIFAEEWNEALMANDDYWDQNAFNDLMNRGAKFEQQRCDRLFLGFDGKLKIGILPVSTFCSGHTFFVQRMADVQGLKPYVVHATFQFSGTPGKRHRMRESLLWDADPPSYFRPKGGLLSFDMHLHGLVEHSAPHQQVLHSVDNSQAVPRQRTMKLDNDKIGHFNLVNAQIQQVRTAMAIASSLKRTLVIPQLWCGMDRWWAPHDGNIPGSSLQLPFPCPMDHIFDLEQMIMSHEQSLGPYIDWREHSLFNNSQFPEEDIAQAAHVHICQEEESKCNDGSKQSPLVKPGSSVGLQANLTDQQIQAALAGLEGVAVIHFDTMISAFGGHANFGDASRFQRRTEVYTSLWCCVDDHPGHVWYDMWWDQVPHEDRHKRQITEAWKPSTGP